MKRLAPQAPLASITKEQWVEMWAKLRLHTWKRYYWLNARLGENLDELAQQAILDTMNGTRRWPPIDARTGEARADISLFSFLCEVVRSNVSHIWDREKRKLSIDTFNQDEELQEFDQKTINNLLNNAAKKYPHLVSTADTESTVIYNLITEKMLKMVEADTEVHEIIKLWREEPDCKPSEIAERLGFDISKVRAAQKRLRRLLRVFNEGSNRR